MADALQNGRHVARLRICSYVPCGAMFAVSDSGSVLVNWLEVSPLWYLGFFFGYKTEGCLLFQNG